MASVKSLQGTRKSLSRKIFLVPCYHSCYIYVSPSPIYCVELRYDAHARRIH